jgi:HAD superfamily hydrolase (TIGR01490 family)
MQIALFDVDHTVTRHSTAFHFLRSGIKRGLFPVRYLLLLPFYFAIYRFGKMKGAFFDRDFPNLRGKTREYLEAIARDCFEESMRCDIFEQARELIGELKADGRRVVFATSSIDFIVMPIARFLGVDQVIANSFGYLEGVCTGRITVPPVFGEEKRRRVLAFLAEEGLQAPDCSFYSDSINDLFLLEAVGRPVTVNPDRRLKRIAERRGWDTLRFVR